MADRRTGVGFDQMVIIDPPKSPETDAFMRIYNADGGEVGACGNASRCIALLLMNELNKNKMILETVAAKLEAERADGGIRVDMGKARHEEIDLSVDRLKDPVIVDVGNPHAVFFVEDAAAVDLETAGPKIEHHPLFPKRINVEVAQILSPSKIRVRVWERGVGITQACGTGACAVAVAGVRRGLTDRKVTIMLEGGELNIEWRESDGHVLMTGPAVEAFRGEVEV